MFRDLDVENTHGPRSNDCGKVAAREAYSFLLESTVQRIPSKPSMLACYQRHQDGFKK